MNKNCKSCKTKVLQSREAMGNIADSSEKIDVNYCKLDNHKGTGVLLTN